MMKRFNNDEGYGPDRKQKLQMQSKKIIYSVTSGRNQVNPRIAKLSLANISKKDKIYNGNLKLAIPSYISNQKDSRTSSIGKSGNIDLPSNWLVNDDTLREVPPYYHLAATSCFLDGISALDISKRVSEYLRVSSVASVFDEKNAAVEATTQEKVQLSIRLFRGNMTYSHGIIVEIQRLNGCSIVFHKVCQGIVMAAKGETIKVSVTRPKKLKLSLTLPEKNKVHHRKNVLSSLEKAIRLLEKNRVDANDLGMQMLCFLTNLDQANHEDAIFASEAILFGNEGYGVENCHKKVFSFLKNRNSFEWYGQEDSDGEEEATNEYTHVLNNLCLKVLRNLLNAMVEISASYKEERIFPWSEEGLIFTLIRELKEAEKRPHDACVAAECFTAITNLSTSAKEIAVELNASPILRKSYQYGTSSHASLAYASQEADRNLNGLILV